MAKKNVALATTALLVMGCAQGQSTQQDKLIIQADNTFVNPGALFDASQNGFSHIGIKHKDAQLIFISGQWASDKEGNLAVTDFAGQVAKTIQNLQTALAAVGLTEKNIIKLTVYIAEYTPEKKIALLQTAAPLLHLKAFPTSVIVPLPVLATHPQSQIEIEAIATK